MPDDRSVAPTWRKSSRSEFGCCVEVAVGFATVSVRNSRHPDGPVLEFSAAAWDAFVAAVREHRYDRPRKGGAIGAPHDNGRCRK